MLPAQGALFSASKHAAVGMVKSAAMEAGEAEHQGQRGHAVSDVLRQR